MRTAPELAPEDSLARFLQEARYLAALELPVQENGILKGVIAQTDVLPLLRGISAEEREKALESPVSGTMRADAPTARPDMSREEVGRLCAEYKVSMVPVADEDGYVLGVVLANDLLLPDMPLPRPSSVGGMATPFGVYLTNGSLQAGVGNLALVVTGFLISLFFTVSYGIVWGAIHLAERLFRLHDSPALNLDFEPNAHQAGLALASIGVKFAVFAVFLVLMRISRLTGYHAAEHQTVHAIERNETLSPEIVARMPRVHPRCGTNFMAAGLLFFTLFTLFSAIPALRDGAELFAALGAVFSWRPLGSFLQDRFTTRRANAGQLASGIAAGNDLLDKYLTCPPSRPRLLRRIWCMGLLQTALGMLLCGGAVTLLTNCWNLRQH